MSHEAKTRKVSLESLYQMLRLIDYEKCMACDTCQSVCEFIHDGKPFIVLYEITSGLRRPISCFHCAKAPCVEACPTGAMTRDPETGIVYIDFQKCIGCLACLYACPFGIPEFSETTNTAVKCDLCRDLVSKGLNPACAAMCPAGAIIIASPNQLNKQVRVKALKKLVQSVQD